MDDLKVSVGSLFEDKAAAFRNCLTFIDEMCESAAEKLTDLQKVGLICNMAKCQQRLLDDIKARGQEEVIKMLLSEAPNFFAVYFDLPEGQLEVEVMPPDLESEVIIDEASSESGSSLRVNYCDLDRMTQLTQPCSEWLPSGLNNKNKNNGRTSRGRGRPRKTAKVTQEKAKVTQKKAKKETPEEALELTAQTIALALKRPGPKAELTSKNCPPPHRDPEAWRQFWNDLKTGLEPAGLTKEMSKKAKLDRSHMF